MKNRNLAINFEREQLNKLVLDDSSCVFLKQCTHHLALHPYHLNNINESLKNILNKGIAKYDKTLGGILLGYQNIKLLSRSGAINNDTCFIHVDIVADFYLFKPEVGKILTGVVNKKSEDHVGCLVHGAFNVSLPKPPEEDDWLGSLVQVGQEILFRITFLDLESRLPYIRATLVSILSELDSGISTGEDTKSSKPHKKKKGKKIIFESNSEGEEVKSSEKKKKKKKRQSTEETTTFETIREDVKPQGSNVKEELFAEDSTKLSKKRKRKHSRSGENHNVETSYEDIELEHCPNSETLEDIVSKKVRSKKKLKMDEISNETLYDESIEHKSKHKHKKKHKNKD